ncbi:altronate dehydratase family protein [Flagellimonas sp. HMM57]|uniref:UxaA family hydrolase n=1 Tax=unclassified Flagellimonas TaxID=2644544 RepID=UPI0013D7435E|nr:MULTISPECIES: altronate dehydratase family protein [unclassified Flagellimonas]UII76518.1 altronate dehydratase family protein [Flagellimonas sp. HMM57]
MRHKFIKIHPSDNVVVALENLDVGIIVMMNGENFQLKLPIKAKHKFAQNDFLDGDEIYMYGGVVGKAKKNIEQGEALTVDNVSHKTEDYGVRKQIFDWQQPDISKFRNKTFNGYHRSDGQVGTANFWVVIPLVFCENRNVAVMKDAFLEELGFVRPNKYKQYVRQMVNQYKSGASPRSGMVLEEETATSTAVFKNVDGIKFLTHQGGCGGIRQDSEMLCALIAGYLNNPNVAGGTILSLGCQNAQISILQEKLKAVNPDFDKPLYILEQQQEGREENLLQKALQKTFEGLVEANKLQREPASLDKLTLGLECGGSDGFSGISANPAVGHASDIVVALSGKTMLAEFPELCGVEQQLINRCTNDAIADKFIHLMQTYAASAEAVGSGFDMNPSPGNIKDGLITDAMKSAGAAKKGGTSPIVDVLDYAEYATKPGLNLLCTPGNDVESTTALAGSGANLILFTTGLGTPTGNPIAPVIKIASNSGLAERMPDIIDVDAGEVITGDKTIEEMGEELMEFIIAVASGKIQTKAQVLNQDDFIPWKRGISL